MVHMKIVDAGTEVKAYIGQQVPWGKIDLLHVNCEGCEYELLLRLVETDMLRHISVLQVSFHNYGAKGIGDLLPKYCLIRESLVKSHNNHSVLPFGWERWVLKHA